MAYVAVDKEVIEWIFNYRPYKYNNVRTFGNGDSMSGNSRRIKLPKGSIEKLIGLEMSWENKPIELIETTIECRCGKNTREDAKCLICGEVATPREKIV